MFSKKLMIAGLLLAVLVITSSCGTIEGYMNKNKNSVALEEAEICIPESEYDQLASKRCDDPNSLYPGKITYFLEGTSQERDGLQAFLDYAEEFVYCSFPEMEDEQVAQSLISKHNQGVDVKIVFDKTGSFDRIGISDIPKKNSKYVDFLAEDMQLQVGNTNANFCASEDGVFISNNEFDNSRDTMTFSVIFYDNPDTPGNKL